MDAFLILTAAVMACLLPWVIGQRFGVIALVSPMHLLAYFCGFGFLAKVIAYCFAPELAFYPAYTRQSWALLGGAVYLTGFVVMLCLGYLAAVRPFPKAEARAVRRQTAAKLRGLWPLAALACLIAYLTLAELLAARGFSGLSWDALQALNQSKQVAVNAVGVGATFAGLKSLFVLPKLAFVLVLARAVSLREPAMMALAVALGSVLLGVALVSADRFELVELALMSVASVALFGGRIGALGHLCALASLLGLCLIAAVMTGLRGSDAGLWQQILGSTYFLDINIAAIVTDRVSPAIYLGGDSYSWWTFGWVPRALWPDKPAIDLGVMLKRDVLGVPTGGAFNVTGPGEAFLNFGWAGVCVGFVLGWMYRKAEVWLLWPSGRAARQLRVVYYPLILMPFVQTSLQSSFSAFVVGAVAQVLLISAMLWLWRVRWPVLCHLPSRAALREVIDAG